MLKYKLRHISSYRKIYRKLLIPHIQVASLSSLMDNPGFGGKGGITSSPGSELSSLLEYEWNSKKHMLISGGCKIWGL